MRRHGERLFLERLRALHEISMELSLAPDFDELCRLAVVLGKARLGFDRIGLWFQDPADPGWNVGSWGIDEEGQLRDERHCRVIHDPIIAPQAFYENKIPLLRYKGAPSYDHRRHIVGHSDKALAPLWDGATMIGELAVDNLLTGRAIDDRQAEIIVTFARIVGNLVKIKRAEAELLRLAAVDPLTGAANRRSALLILEKQLALCLRGERDLSLAYVDLDGLKSVNDGLGHAAGDEYIKAAAQALLGRIRSSDTVGRIGGDEFIAFFPDSGLEEASIVMAEVEAYLQTEANPRVRLSWGAASLRELEGGHRELGDLAEALVSLADRRMYEVKRSKSDSR